MWLVPCHGQQFCHPSPAFPSGEFAVFYDYGSLVQKDGDGQRTPEDAAAFSAAMVYQKAMEAGMAEALAQSLPHFGQRHLKKRQKKK